MLWQARARNIGRLDHIAIAFADVLADPDAAVARLIDELGLEADAAMRREAAAFVLRGRRESGR